MRYKVETLTVLNGTITIKYGDFNARFAVCGFSWLWGCMARSTTV
jgi:hypothetical protein